MYPDELILWHSKKTERIIVAQVLLDSKGQLGDILDALYIAGEQTYLIEFLFVERNVIVSIFDHAHQTSALSPSYDFAGRTFGIIFEIILI